MGDLYIDGDMLQRVKRSFGDIENLLDGPARQMRGVTGEEMGPRTLVDRVRDFGDDWSYGIEELGEFSGSVVDALQAVADAFQEAEDNLADALNEAKEDG